MREVVNNEQMRESDRYTIETLGVDSLELMERAGRAIAAEVPRGGSICVVCGGGNNGGDGYVTARYLLERGEDVCVVSLSEKRSHDCQVNYEKFRGPVYTVFPRMRYTVMVDCIFGTGLSRTVEGIYRAGIDFINHAGAYVVSADIPSGLSDCGMPLGACVRADKTVTVQAEKLALRLNDAPDYCGEIVTADIGIVIQGRAACIYEGEDLAACFPARRRNSHKGQYGTGVILAGSAAYTGAPLLSAGALRRMGAGYGRLCICESVFPAMVGRYPELILTAFPERDGGLACDEDALAPLMKASSIAFGMGCGVREEIARIADYLLTRYCGTLILDADALNSLAAYGMGSLQKKDKKCGVIVTPHLKEFSRLANVSLEEIKQNGLGLAEAFARETGAVVVLKSAVSVITDGTRTALNITGSPALAKGGSGDVLSGILCGLAARLPVWESAVCGCYLLGKAGEDAARRLGEYSATATDVIDSLPSCVVALSENAHQQGQRQ